MPIVLYPVWARRGMIIVEMDQPSHRRLLMVHDILLAAVFLAMVVTPALLTMRGANKENE